ncbi:MAG: hypothetical protein LH468_12355 [Nocardioides sp.]|nr:hypothetical protein [Nocardioides sp.]
MAADKDRNPVVIGLVALAGVGLAVGLLVSGAALGASQFLGLSDAGSGGTGGTATARESMFLPTPVPTPQDDSPALTLAPEPTPDLAAPGGVAPAPSASQTPAGITLSASTTQARPGDEITLSGAYPGGDGATLAIERLTGGTWTSFADVTTSVDGDTFSTYIRTSQPGESRFRVRDLGSELASNEITFTIG